MKEDNKEEGNLLDILLQNEGKLKEVMNGWKDSCRAHPEPSKPRPGGKREQSSKSDVAFSAAWQEK